jgi:HTH-type transcriptional regulator, cell division transcriptional repressor
MGVYYLLYNKLCSRRILSPSISLIIFYVEKKNIIGARVQQARKSANPPITQNDLVARLQLQNMSIDQSGLSKLENGLRPISDIEVLALARALKVAPEWLLDVETYSKA